MNLGLSVLLVDDHLVVRKGVELVLLGSFPKAHVYSAENYEDAIDIVKTIKLDLIILDININGVENIKIMKSIKEIQSKVKILIFSSHEEKNYGVRYISNGADGFLNKFCTEDKIVKAVNQILKDGYFYSESVREKIEQKSNKKAKNNSIESLSNREFEIAKLLISGDGNLEISNKLNIQMSTVSTYKNRIFEKLNINNVVSLSEFFKENE
ncbi:response regulator transcription factor [Flavobacterium sp.]|uniref:response regulator transcription factor n=1 Tax=Flavobacterium sp. TaxID=239 RepID=UPI00261A90C6|nr:response regulator transcription factor [Flavobacterium sp.]